MIKKIDMIDTYYAIIIWPVEASQKWVHKLHFCLYLGQFLTNFKNSFFLWKLMKIAIWPKVGAQLRTLRTRFHRLWWL